MNITLKIKQKEYPDIPAKYFVKLIDNIIKNYINVDQPIDWADYRITCSAVMCVILQASPKFKLIEKTEIFEDTEELLIGQLNEIKVWRDLFALNDFILIWNRKLKKEVLINIEKE